MTMDDLPGVALARVFQLWQRDRKAAMRDLNLGLMEVSVLAQLLWLDRHEGIPTQAVLADRIGADKMTVSQSVRSLTRKDHVESETNAADGRSRAIRLTAGGRQLAAVIVEKLNTLNASFFLTLGTDEPTFVDLHHRLIHANQEGNS